MENSTASSQPSASDTSPIPKPGGRFNDWGERKWIEVPSEKLAIVDRELSELKLTPRAGALYQAARFTESSGAEFVFVSNAQFPGPVIFHRSGIHIIPCFIPLRLAHGVKSEDRQMAMMKRGQFIYDGWIPNNEWTRAKFEQIVSALDDLVNVFSIVGKYYAYWQPKYYYPNNPVPSHLIYPTEFAPLSKTIEVIEYLPQADRQAISRSVAWISNALRDESTVQRFLLLFVSIESLVTYIERESEKDSPLRTFAADRLTKSARKQQRETCIQEIMNSNLELTQAVQEAYFECVVGSKTMLEGHLSRVFGNDKASRVIFVERTGEKTLWELRNDIAHGSLNVLSEEDIRTVSSRVALLEEIAREYLRRILAHVAQADYFPKTRPPIFTIPASTGIGAPGTHYMGPTDMAEYYANVEILASSHIRIGFQ